MHFFLDRPAGLHHDKARNHRAPDQMISKYTPLTQLQASETERSARGRAAPERLSRRASLLVIAGVSTLLWVGVAMIAGKLLG